MTIIAEDSPQYLFDVKGVTVLPEPKDTVPTADAFRFWRLRDVVGSLCLYVSDLSTLNNWHVIEDALKHDL